MRRSPAVWIVLFMLTGTTALAQTTRPETSVKAATAGENSSKGLLAGPTVDEIALRETDSRFGGPGRARDQVTVPIRQWLALLRTLELNDEQDVEVRRLVQTYRSAARDYQRTHSGRSRQLQAQAREARSVGRDVQPKVRRELVKLRSLAPKPAKTQERIWALLTESQQASMRNELSEIRERIIQRRAARKRTDAMSPAELDDRAQRRNASPTARQSHQDDSGEVKDER